MSDIHEVTIERRSDGKYALTIRYSTSADRRAEVKPAQPEAFTITPDHVALPEANPGMMTEVLTMARLGDETSCSVVVTLDANVRVRAVDVP